MLIIKSPKNFLKIFKIFNFLLGVISILIGFYLFVGLIIRVFIIQGYFRDPIQYGIFSILFIASGILGLLSFITIKKSKEIGIDIGMVSFVLLALNLIFMSLYIFITDILRQLSGLHLAVSFSSFLFFVVSSLFLFYLIFIIKHNKEILKHNL